jgi:hypothetical protein
MSRKRIGILIFHDVEVLDFCGPFEVFSVTRLNESRRREEPSPFEVLLIAESIGANYHSRRHERVATSNAAKLPAA